MSENSEARDVVWQGAAHDCGSLYVWGVVEQTPDGKFRAGYAEKGRGEASTFPESYDWHGSFVLKEKAISVAQESADSRAEALGPVRDESAAAAKARIAPESSRERASAILRRIGQKVRSSAPTRRGTARIKP